MSKQHQMRGVIKERMFSWILTFEGKADFRASAIKRVSESIQYVKPYSIEIKTYARAYGNLL